jgi:hypothetical protein
MKNIHLIPTDKLSRIRIGNNGNFVFGMIQTSIQSKNDSFTNQHIYITSDEEIKEGNWVFDSTNYGLIHKVWEVTEKHFSFKDSLHARGLKSTNRNLKCHFKKIILTDNPDLIKDGVQAIDNEFLEWLVRNNSCEIVEVTRDFADEGIKGITYYGKYFIIIPKEEPKQNCENCKQPISKYGCACGIQIEEPKQETLEQADYEKLKQLLIEFRKVPITFVPDERRYSEEEVRMIVKDAYAMGRNNILIGVFNKWFEQFRKKSDGNKDL